MLLTKRAVILNYHVSSRTLLFTGGRAYHEGRVAGRDFGQNTETNVESGGLSR